MTTGYFITGASGFIGKRLVKKILARDNTTVYYLSRASGAKGEKQRAALMDYWGADEKRVVAVLLNVAAPNRADAAEGGLGFGREGVKGGSHVL